MVQDCPNQCEKRDRSKVVIIFPNMCNITAVIWNHTMCKWSAAD